MSHRVRGGSFMISEKAATYRQLASRCREEADKREQSKDKVAWETGEKCWLHMAVQADIEILRRDRGKPATDAKIGAA
jgi:hypothetical protein